MDDNAKQAVWLHFHVLAERQCIDSFDQIIKNRENAAEKYENYKVFGYKLEMYTNTSEKVRKGFLRSIQCALDNVDLIAFIVLIIGLINGRNILWGEDNLIIIFGLLSTLLVIYRLKNFMDETELKKKVYLTYKSRVKVLEDILHSRKIGDERFKNPNRQKDPVFLMLTALRMMRFEEL